MISSKKTKLKNYKGIKFESINISSTSDIKKSINTAFTQDDAADFKAVMKILAKR